MIITPHHCTSCNTCYERCPVDAIRMVENTEGFKQPIINEDSCIHCKLCIKVCPLNETSYTLNTFDNPECLAVWNKDETIRLQSSSGGIFSLLATRTLAAGGQVCGAAFDEYWQVKHILISKKEELQKLRGSKYVQSDINSIFSQIKALLKSKTPILFSGTACQVAGLYSYLGKDDPLLLTIDVLCHGTPSPKVWAKYIKENFGDESIQHINFRNKDHSWDDYHLSIQTDKRLYQQSLFKDIYMQGFLKDLYLKESCYECVFAKTKRNADITLGDFWGIQKYNPKFNDQKGTSLILLNSPKGQEMYAKILGDTKLSQSIPLPIAIRDNPVLIRPCMPHPKRESFYEQLDSAESINMLIRQSIGLANVAIFSPPSNRNLYESSLSRYALNRAIEKLGYIPYLIDYLSKKEKKTNIFGEESIFEQFQHQFIRRTCSIQNNEDLRDINNNFRRILSHADELNNGMDNYRALLNWAHNEKNIISYGMSFSGQGVASSKLNKSIASKLLQRLDARSCLSTQDLRILKHELSSTAEQVIPAILLLEAEDYQDIIDKQGVQSIQKNYHALMLTRDGKGEAHRKIALAQSASITFIDSLRERNLSARSLGEWLSLLKNSQSIICDDTTGIMLALIFDKAFIYISAQTNSRVESLSKEFELDNCHFINTAKQISSELIAKAILSDSTRKLLAKKRTQSFQYLEKALAIEPQVKARPNPMSSIGIIISDIIADFQKIKRDAIQKYYY